MEVTSADGGHRRSNLRYAWYSIDAQAPVGAASCTVDTEASSHESAGRGTGGSQTSIYPGDAYEHLADHAKNAVAAFHPTWHRTAAANAKQICKGAAIFRLAICKVSACKANPGMAARNTTQRDSAAAAPAVPRASLCMGDANIS